MKAPLLLFALPILLTVACGKAGLDETGLPHPSSALAAKAGISLDEMGDGYWVFNRKCMECHESRLPKVPLKKQWHPTVSGSSGNVGLSASEDAALMKYVQAANLL